MKKGEMVITVTTSVTYTDETEITEITRTLEMVGKNGKRTVVKQETSKTTKPLDFWKAVFKEVA